ncbi:nuclear transport factor 2 family protein [Curtobacterium sp. GD1]|uniref:nuclear transport factor 2 family protein n=1 Tax=Curtobacterium sp. GD1 TaxID=2810612 RepID=UPI001E5C2330|nr:nuclear transport factor 2 family protein [Curtobacterium sp. GD1]MCC8907839.1 nuclear transport factor 2 family protein [Curtobacterium sp. GD1]
MATVSELLTANLHDVFGNRDAASRRAAIERTYSPDVTFTDPEATAVGWDALEQKAAELLETVPGAFQFVEEGRRYVSETHGALAWGFGPVGAPAVRGIDVVEVRDGVVVSLTTFFAEPTESA